MKLSTIVIIGVLAVPALCYAGDSRELVRLTLASLLLLAFLPPWLHRHVRKTGTYHHEISHGLMSLLTGGCFHRFHVHPNGSGVAHISGGKPKLVISAGYVGTILFGVVYVTRSAQSDGLVTTLYVLVLLYALSIIKAGDLHTASIGAVMAATLGLATQLAPGSLAVRFLLNLNGVLLICDGLFALWTLHLVSATATNTGSDAETMGQLTGKHPAVWSAVFSMIAVAILFVAMVGFVTTQ
ncbi:MAG: M50 family metallopeptidase [Candidatus Nealsonbacteria bacterium]|nr:M50 family metallopeptidase [Candidatus Nealsonbacteria bacterium]